MEMMGGEREREYLSGWWGIIWLHQTDITSMFLEL